MKKISFIFLVTIFIVVPVQASWIKNYGDSNSQFGQVVEITPDGGYFIIGNTYSEETEFDILLIKTDENGDTMWTKTYGGLLNDFAYSGQITTDGGFIIAGYTESSGAGEFDAWLLMTDPDGDTTWTQTYGDTGFDIAQGIYQTTDGGFVVTGYRDGILNQEYDYPMPGDIWLFKVLETGTLEWEKTYGSPDEDFEEGHDVRQTSDGGYIVCCDGLKDAMTLSTAKLLKTDTAGDTVWVYRTQAYRSFNCIRETPDGSFMIAGNFDIGDLGLAKFDLNGSLLWEKTYGLPTPENDWANWIEEISDDNYIVTGTFDAIFTPQARDGDIWLLKVDENGDTLWTRKFGEKPQYDNGNCVRQTSDGGFIVTGLSETYSNGGYDICLIKTDSLGYVAVEENPISYHDNGLELITPIGREITLRYADRSQGFHAEVFDASGRKVDEIRSVTTNGTFTWGVDFVPGVYFIREISGTSLPAKKVILVK